MKPKHFMCVYMSMCLKSCYSHCHLVVLLLFLHSSLSAGVTVCFVLTLQWMRVESNRPRTPVQTRGSQKTASASAMTLGNHLWILSVLSSASNKPSPTQTYWPLHLVPLSDMHSKISKHRHIERKSTRAKALRAKMLFKNWILIIMNRRGCTDGFNS